ncbi:tetratricopeptide repeat protein [Amycolatopsis sp. NPDC098790]|uniref:tetratricopeptide repeat protein n=1 Tax=Amycolatopsis sp. NPDC098790 TaxID=3363939 RepID=UPI0037F98DAF
MSGIVGTQRAAAEPAALGDLVRLCARLPLALRIAAGRVTSTPLCTVAEVVDELADDRFRLDALSPGGDERAAVRAVFDWSYQQLATAPARLFRRLGLLPGSDFSLHTAAALADLNSAEARRQLESLTTVHLIEPSRGNRYQFHDLLRVYAFDQAHRYDDAQERHEAIEAFLGWYAKTAYLCDELLYPAHPRTPAKFRTSAHRTPDIRDAAQALSWLEDERGNMLLVLQQAVETQMYDQGLNLAENSRFLGRNGRWYDELEGARFGLICARSTGDRQAETRFHNWLGEVLINTGRWDEARDNFERALSAARKLADDRQLANALNGIGLLRSMLGNHEDALPCFHEALPLSRGIDTGRLESVIEGNISSALSGLHRFEEALRHGERSLELRRRSGDVAGAVHSTHCLARAHLGLGQHGEAIALCRKAIAEGRGVNYTSLVVAEPLDTLGVLLNLGGDTAGAIECWREAAALFDSYSRPQRATEVRARIETAGAAEAR